jgi:transketolase
MSTRFERDLFDPKAEPGKSVFDHFVFVIAGDGDMMEGVSGESASLAGHLGLGNLVVIYDANQISIEDDTNISFTEDVAARYRAYGWETIEIDWRGSEYREDVAALYEAIEQAKVNTEQPTLITLRTIIGWPSPTKQNTGKIHGSKLGEEEVRGLKQAIGFNPAENFEIPAGVLEHTRDLVARGKEARASWDADFAKWQDSNPEEAKLLERLMKRELPADLEQALPQFADGEIATRAASGKVVNAVAAKLPELWGGSADLAESNNTTIEGAGSFVPARWDTAHWSPTKGGRILHFGVREHAMGSILNGIRLSGHSRPFGGTFLVFSDYMRPAVRLAALMGIAPIYVWTHDSVALGEDGPTHQPIEHLTALRVIPNLDVVRPADANETAYAWLEVLKRQDNPAAMVLTRQNLPVLDRGAGFGSANEVAKGGYVYADAESGNPDVILIATGSEVQFAVAAKTELAASGIEARVVSMPCVEWFRQQQAEYREQVLPAGISARVSIEAGLSTMWREFVGDAGIAIGIDHYGASADYKTLYQEFGITTEAVVSAAKKVAGKN